MPDYRIIITPDAIRDLNELRTYIADVLLAPDTALKYIQTIRREIGGLARMPARHMCVDQEPWHSRGVRKIIVKNFFVIIAIVFIVINADFISVTSFSDGVRILILSFAFHSHF